MDVPPELMLCPNTNSFRYDMRSSEQLHLDGSRPLASCRNNPFPIPPPPPSLLDSILQKSERRLRMELAEESGRKAAVFLQILEANAAHSMREKEVELEWARKRKRELEARLVKTEAARRAWQKLAREKEATVAELSSVLERVGEGDAESTAEEMILNEKKMVCRVCHRRSSSVLLLPCRHLCSCEPCEPALLCCPLCQTGKKASINVFFGLD